MRTLCFFCLLYLIDLVLGLTFCQVFTQNTGYISTESFDGTLKLSKILDDVFDSLEERDAGSDHIVRKIFPSLDVKFNSDSSLENRNYVSRRYKSAENYQVDGRTFGLRKRMQLFLWAPISFKLGVIVTLLLVLTTISAKTLILGIVILFILLTKYHHSHANWWSGYKTPQISTATKDVHIHVHTLPIRSEHHYDHAHQSAIEYQAHR